MACLKCCQCNYFQWLVVMTTAWGGGMHECKQSPPPPWQYWLFPLLASLTGLAAPSPLRDKKLWKPSSLPYTAWYVWLIVVTIYTHTLGGWMKLQTIRSHSWLVLGRYELIMWWSFVYFHTWLLNGPEVALVGVCDLWTDVRVHRQTLSTSCEVN